jgi:hypothetical protein
MPEFDDPITLISTERKVLQKLLLGIDFPETILSAKENVTFSEQEQEILYQLYLKL